jgi:hypothetical protein
MFGMVTRLQPISLVALATHALQLHGLHFGIIAVELQS